MNKKKKIIIICTIVVLIIVSILSFGWYRIKNAEIINKTLVVNQPFEIEEGPFFILKGKTDYDQKKYSAAGEYEIELIDKSLHVKKYIFSVKAYEKPVNTSFACQTGDKISLSKQKGLSYKFSSSNPDSFFVSENGEVTVLKQDAKATITAVVNDYQKEEYTFCSSAVNINISKEKLYIGENVNIVITGYSGNVTWKKTGNSIEIDESIITAVNLGKTTISVEIGGKKYTYNIEVIDNPNIDAMDLIIGQEKEVVANNLADDTAVFEIEDEKIASYDNGKIKALSEGSTNILGKIRDREFGAVIKVYKPAIKDNDKELKNDNAEIKTFAVQEEGELSLEIENYGNELNTVSDNDNIIIKEVSDGNIIIEGNTEGDSLLTITTDGYELQAQVKVYNKNAIITQKEWMQAIKDWCDYMINDGDWIYSNSNNRRNVDLAIKESHRTNCAMMVVHAMQRAGILTKGNSFYSDKNHEKRGSEESWKEIRKNAEVIEFNDGKTPDKAGLQQGDICMWNGHVNIFAGYNSKGKQTWYDAGSKMTIEKKDGGTFANFFKTANRSKKIYTIIRPHYIPE